MPHKPKQAAVDLDTLTGAAANLRAVAGDELMQAAIDLLRERLDLTPEKVMALLLRIVAPETIPFVREECDVRGVSDKTLRAMKDAKEIPPVLQR